jgi:hypothetical protein
MEIDELEPGPSKAVFIARELREAAEVIERCPDLENPLDAAQRMLTDLDSLDVL